MDIYRLAASVAHFSHVRVHIPSCLVSIASKASAILLVLVLVLA